MGQNRFKPGVKAVAKKIINTFINHRKSVTALRR